ncbi:MAG TPA: GNAT family N-acetyltransferase [Bdellovibrionota bacterium]|jgi:GNAT superfamily N-acetyltransferase
MQVTYRKAEKEDAPAIQSFQLAMAWETEKLKLNEATLKEGVGAVFNSPEIGSYHVCCVDGEVAGSLLLLKEWSDWRNGNVWWIHSVYVKPEFRGQKLFSGMYAYVKKMAEADSKVRGLRLYVEKTNRNAQGVYEKLGMNGEHYSLFEWMKTF